jgi:hypothetical protein|tara:strand:- start:3436 stop:3612 length:177 start_codon:yes stop_codon:yes gene_type:complete
MAGFKKDEVTPEYVNKKLESMMSAIFDTIGENEDRMKNIEKRLFELIQEVKEWKKADQ